MADTIYTGTDGRTYALSEDGKTLSVSGEGSMNSVYSNLLRTSNGNIDVSGVETLNIAEGITECGTSFNIRTIKGTVTFPTTFFRMRNIFDYSGNSGGSGGPDEIIIKYNSTGTFYFGGVRTCPNVKKIIFTSPTKITITGEMQYLGDGYHVVSIYSKDNCAMWDGKTSGSSGIKPYNAGQSNQSPHQFTIYGGEYSEDTTQKITTPTKEIQCDSAIKDELGNRISTTYLRIPSNYKGYYMTGPVTITTLGEVIYGVPYVKTQGDNDISNGTLTVIYGLGHLAGVRYRIVNVDENTLPSAGSTQTFSLAYNCIGWGTPTVETIFSQLCVNRTSTEQEISLYTRRRSNSRDDMVELIVRLEETTDDAKLILRKTVSGTTTETTIATL